MAEIEQQEQNRIAIVIGVLAAIFILHPIVFCSEQDVEKIDCQTDDSLKFLLGLTELAAVFYGLYLFLLALFYTPNNQNFSGFRDLAHSFYGIGSILAIYFMAIVIIPVFGILLKIEVPGWFYNIGTVFLLILLTYEMFFKKNKLFANKKEKWIRK